MAVESKRSQLRDGYLTHWLWDRLVFNKVKERLGGRVKCIVTGSAPISPQGINNFVSLLFFSPIQIFFSKYKINSS